MFGLIWLQLYCVGRRTVGAIPQHLGGAKIWVALKMRDRNLCIWRSYLDGFYTKRATWWARVPPPTPQVSCTCMHTACFQHTPYARSYRKGTGGNQDTSMGCEEGVCGTDIPSGKLCSVRLGYNVWTHSGCLDAYSDNGKTLKSQWLILTWRLSESGFPAGWATAPYLTSPLGTLASPERHGGSQARQESRCAPASVLVWCSLTHTHRWAETQALFLFRNNESSEGRKKNKKGEVRILIC